jgi:hypothetical protein
MSNLIEMIAASMYSGGTYPLHDKVNHIVIDTMGIMHIYKYTITLV